MSRLARRAVLLLALVATPSCGGTFTTELGRSYRVEAPIERVEEALREVGGLELGDWRDAYRAEREVRGSRADVPVRLALELRQERVHLFVGVQGGKFDLAEVSERVLADLDEAEIAYRPAGR